MPRSSRSETLDRCTIASLGYLERNDFTSIRQIDRHLIFAKDGTRKVYLWIDLDDSGRHGGVVVPCRVLERAARERARVDVINLSVDGRSVLIKHMMNV